jgi:hypothetical protein
MLADLVRYGHLNGAGVRLFFADANLRQEVNDHLGFDFELASQLIDPNLTFVAHPAL